MSRATAVPPDFAARLNDLYSDPAACAELAGLRYVDDAEPGIRRLRCGRGFRYLDVRGRAVNGQVRERLAALAVPPAWKDVWLCVDDGGHLLATGVDDRGRKQYLYHERWRETRESLNFARLIPFSDALPIVRRNVSAQLRRRTLDRQRVLAAMVRIIDGTAMRIGNEVYAEENDSFGLSTLSRRHVVIRGDSLRMTFPAKSGRKAELTLRDAAVARVVAALLEQRSRRLFTVDGERIDSDAVNAALDTWAGARVTAKDFRTWHGTRVAFETIETAKSIEAEQVALAAVDATAEWLGNTRDVARSSYVHPQLLTTVLDGTFDDLRPTRTPRSPAELSAAERRLRAFLVAVWSR